MIESGTMATLRVLLIDDDPGFRRETEAILAERNYSVLTAADFGRAGGVLAQHRGRMAVLSELNVSGGSGIAFLGETLKKYPNVPFTFLSDSPPLDAVIEALRQGAYDFLRKPVAPDILCHSVARSIEKLNLCLETEQHERENRELLARSRARVKAIEELSDLKSFVISMAAHDFKSLVTVLDGYRQTLQEFCAQCPQPVPAEVAAQAARSITRLYRMAGSLLDFEAAEKGEISVELRPFDLDALLLDCLAFYRPYAAQKKVVLDIDPPLPAIIAKGDPDRVLEILDNLLTNALKFTPAKGEIGMGVRLDGRRAIVWVRDTGSGIPRHPSGKTAGEKGAHPGNRDSGARIGLGLKICRKLVEIQKGEMWIESAPGSGTRVSFSLPV